MGRRALWLSLLLFTLGGECEPREQTCLGDTECLEPFEGFGRCVEAHCSFIDARCPSGYRWDDAADKSRRNRCVPTELVPDAGSLDAG